MKMFVVAALVVFGAVSAQAESGEPNPWLNPEVLNRQAAGLPITGPAKAVSYVGCYTTYATLAKAQRACPPGVSAVKLTSWSGRTGFTCQCAIDTDRGGNN